MGSKIAIAAAVIAACVIASAIFLITRPRVEQVEQVQVWWILADPHVGFWPFLEMGIGRKPVEHLEVAVRDVNELGIADYALALGDLVSDSAEYASIFLGIMDNLKVKGWHYVLGNHDHDWQKWENILPIVYKGFDVLGIRFVLISDELGYKGGVHHSGGVMGEEQFDWLWTELHIQRDKPIFLFSHQPYYQWNIWRKVRPAFEENIFSVDVWFHGHSHIWAVENTPYGFTSFGVNSVDWKEQYESIFLFVKAMGGEVEVEIRARNHLQGVWLEEPHYKLTFETSKARAAGMGMFPLTTATMLAAAVFVLLLILYQRDRMYSANPTSGANAIVE